MTNPVLQARIPPFCAAFTLVETMAALALAGLVCLSTLMMLTSASSAARSELVLRQALVNGRLTSLRAAAAFRSASALLASSQDRTVLWAGDADASGAPSLPELRYVRFDPSQGEVWVFQPSSNQVEGLSADLDFDDDFLAIAEAAAGSATMPGLLVLDGIGQWDVRVSGADLQSARIVLITASWEPPDGEPVTATVVASFRGTPAEANAP